MIGSELRVHEHESAKGVLLVVPALHLWQITIKVGRQDRRVFGLSEASERQAVSCARMDQFAFEEHRRQPLTKLHTAIQRDLYCSGFYIRCSPLSTHGTAERLFTATVKRHSDGTGYIEIADRGGTAAFGLPTPNREGGRGLYLVTALTSAWGVKGDAAGEAVTVQIAPGAQVAARMPTDPSASNSAWLRACPWSSLSRRERPACFPPTGPSSRPATKG